MPVSVLFLCLGNICRSPLAEGVFRRLVADLGRANDFHIDSAGTSGYHQGSPPDPGSVRIALERGFDIRAQRSRPFLRPDGDLWDFVVAMDRSNARWVRERYPLDDERLVLLRRFDPDDVDLDVPDPYGGGPGGFAEVTDILVRSMPHLLGHIDRVGARSSR